MRILVTGSEGNVGKRLVPYLRERGHVIARCDAQIQYADDYTIVDVRNPTALAGTFADFKPEAVLHLAAIVGRIVCERSPCLTIDTNINGTNNLIQLCKQYSSRLMYFSTSEVYGNDVLFMTEDIPLQPNNRYGLSKYIGELLVRYEVENHDLDALIVRLFMFYHEDETRGVHRSAMVRFCESLLRGEQITVHEGARRSWMHMSDGMRVIEKLLYTEGFHTVNIGNPGAAMDMLDLAKLICDRIGIGYELITESALPTRMTLQKLPDLKKQHELTGIDDFIGVDKGVDRLLERLRSEL